MNESSQQELERLAPLLSAIPKVELYRAPDGYFDSLDQHVRERINSSSRQSTRWWESLLRPALTPALAAVLGLVLTVGIWLSGNERAEGMDSIQYASIEELIDEDLLIEELTLQAAQTSDAMSLNEFLIEDYDESLLIEELE